MINRPALFQAGNLGIHPGHDFFMRDAWPWIVDGRLNFGGQPCGEVDGTAICETVREDQQE